MIPVGCFSIQRINIFRFIFIIFKKLCLHLDSCIFGKDRRRLTKSYLFNFHEKLYRSSSFSTGKTMGDIFARRDDKRWCFFTMKWTESLIIDSCFFGRYISVNNIKDLYTRLDVFTQRHTEKFLKNEGRYFWMMNSILSILDETVDIQNGENEISISFTCPSFMRREMASFFESHAIRTFMRRVSSLAVFSKS